MISSSEARFRASATSKPEWDAGAKTAGADGWEPLGTRVAASFDALFWDEKMRFGSFKTGFCATENERVAFSFLLSFFSLSGRENARVGRSVSGVFAEFGATEKESVAFSLSSFRLSGVTEKACVGRSGLTVFSSVDEAS